MAKEKEIAFEERGVVVREGADAIQEFGQLDLGIVRATAIATQLASIIKAKKLSVRIGSSEHLKVEAWCTVASMVGVSPITEWSHEIRDPSTGTLDGFRARVQVIRIATGATIGGSEAACWANELQRTRDKVFYHRWSDYCPRYKDVPTMACTAPITWHAVESMAITRATSKSIGQILRFIPVLAGYSGTPAEEMTGDRGREAPFGRPPQDSGERVISEAQVGRLWAVVYNKAETLGVFKGDAESKLRTALKSLGFDSTKELTRVPYDTLVKMAEEWTADSFEPQPEQQEME